MRAPRFWTATDLASRLAAAALTPLGWLYGASVAYKARQAKPHRSKAKVVCVGNLTAGGSGKTPIAIEIARTLMRRGQRVVFLSRGYGGRMRGPSFVDPARDSAADCGDEPLLLANTAPVIVARDRIAGAGRADAEGFDWIVMDDGHQNFALAKDLSIVVVDAETGFGNGRVLPAGPLREPVGQGLSRADGVILVGTGSPALPGYDRPVLRAALVPSSQSDLAGKPVVAFAGIGRPDKFFATLRQLGASTAHAQGFGDHHSYTASELARLKAKARDNNAVLITTEKDYVRLLPPEREGIQPLPVRAQFDDAAALTRLLDQAATSGTFD